MGHKLFYIFEHPKILNEVPTVDVEVNPKEKKAILMFLVWKRYF